MPIRLNNYHEVMISGMARAQQEEYAQISQHRMHILQQYGLQSQQQRYYLESQRPEIELYIPTAMEDWDKEFWLVTGIVVPGTTCRDLI